MAAAQPMNQDDDVERLFSWLQTPDLRYREFAGAREVTDAVVTLRDRANTPVVEVVPPQPPAPPSAVAPEPYGFHSGEPSPAPTATLRETVMRETVTRETVMREAAIREATLREPTIIAPTSPSTPPAVESETSRPAEIVQPPAFPPAEPIATLAPPPVPSPPQPSPPAAMVPAATDEDRVEDAPKPGDSQATQSRPLDAVFGRLAGGNARPPDPRERLRHIPGLGPPAGRSR